MAKFATDEQINLAVLVDTEFEQRVAAAALNLQYRGNKSEWARDVLARALGFSSYAHYIQSVKDNQLVNCAVAAVA
jgi:hypothetical protein